MNVKDNIIQDVHSGETLLKDKECIKKYLKEASMSLKPYCEIVFQKVLMSKFFVTGTPPNPGVYQ